MSFYEVRILSIVAIQTQRRGRLGEMEAVLRSRLRACFVSHVASVAAHVKRGMTAALLRHM